MSVRCLTLSVGAPEGRGAALDTHVREAGDAQHGVEARRRRESKSAVSLTTNSTHALLAAARASVGVTVLPRFVARHHDDLVAVSDAVAENDVWLITHPEFRRDPKVQATADFLKRIASEPDGLC